MLFVTQCFEKTDISGIVFRMSSRVFILYNKLPQQPTGQFYDKVTGAADGSELHTYFNKINAEL